MEERIREQWESNSQAFAELIGGSGTPHHRTILVPCIDEMLGNLTGKRLLDAGCGEGYLSIRYAERGADVTGVDISEKLVAVARERDEKHLATFHIGDICNLHDIADQSFDVVLCNLVLLNVPCYREAIAEFARVLRPSGALVLSVVHPAFDFYGPGAWEMGEKDPQTHRREGLFFKMDHYFEEKEYQRYWKTRTGERFPKPISFYHRTLSSYFNALIKRGFVIERVAEPIPVTDDPFFDRERRIPFFLVVRARIRDKTI